MDSADPSSHSTLRANRIDFFFGRPTSPEMQAMRDRWFLATDRTAQQDISRHMQRVAFDQVPYLHLVHRFTPTATRADLVGPMRAPFPIFWNVRRS